MSHYVTARWQICCLHFMRTFVIIIVSLLQQWFVNYRSLFLLSSFPLIQVLRFEYSLSSLICSVTFSSVEKILNGWVWDGILMSETKYALITAHNTVVLWDSVTNEHQATSSCEEQCILYLSCVLLILLHFTLPLHF